MNGAVIGGVQLLLARNISWFADISDTIDYTDSSVIWLGAMLGLGALLGDAVKSFFKRQFGVPSGASWFPFDQTDYIIGALVITLPFVSLPLTTVIVIILLYGLLHPIVNILGWMVHLKPRPF